MGSPSEKSAIFFLCHQSPTASAATAASLAAPV